MKIAIWLDDDRDPRVEPWRSIAQSRSNGAERIVWAENFEEFCAEIERHHYMDDQIVAVMFDIYLGYGLKTGHDCFNWFESFVMENNLPSVKMHCHSQADREERFKMKQGILRMRRYFGDMEQEDGES